MEREKKKKQKSKEQKNCISLQCRQLVGFHPQSVVLSNNLEQKFDSFF